MKPDSHPIPQSDFSDQKKQEQTSFPAFFSQKTLRFIDDLELHTIRGNTCDDANRLNKEVKSLIRGLPCEQSSSIFMIVKSNDMSKMKALISGSAGTPYAHGLFEFQINLPQGFPRSPPQMQHLTSSKNNFGFGPNLYNDGYICLSIIGTWDGDQIESWNPSKNLLQVLLSIQCLVMEENIISKEPGYQDMSVNSVDNLIYVNMVRWATVAYAMLNTLKNPPEYFQQVVFQYFRIKKDLIIQNLNQWLEQASRDSLVYDGKDCAYGYNQEIYMRFRAQGQFKILYEVCHQLRDLFLEKFGDTPELFFTEGVQNVISKGEFRPGSYYSDSQSEYFQHIIDDDMNHYNKQIREDFDSYENSSVSQKLNSRSSSRKGIFSQYIPKSQNRSSRTQSMQSSSCSDSSSYVGCAMKKPINLQENKYPQYSDRSDASSVHMQKPNAMTKLKVKPIPPKKIRNSHSSSSSSYTSSCTEKWSNKHPKIPYHQSDDSSYYQDSASYSGSQEYDYSDYEQSKDANPMLMKQPSASDPVAPDSTSPFFTALSPLRVNMMEFSQSQTKNLQPEALARVNQEIKVMGRSLPCEQSGSVFVAIDSNNLGRIRALVSGNPDSPYENGLYYFDFTLPENYPKKPPIVKILNTGNGKMRFNPNLYDNGFVCLSIINTWQGSGSEKWNPNFSTVMQVLLSIQALVMDKEVLQKEPGFQHVQEGDKENTDYQVCVKYGNIKFAMTEIIRNPPVEFQEVIKLYFQYKKEEILRMGEKWVQEVEGYQIDLGGNLVNSHNSSTVSLFSQRSVHGAFVEAFEELKEALDSI